MGSQNEEIFHEMKQGHTLVREDENRITSYNVCYTKLLRTTDRTVNLVTKELFARYPDPASLSAASQEDVEIIIHATGFFHAKARNIIAAARTLINSYGGEVPDEISKLVTLPGVGRKTANIVIHHAFGRADGIAVDTHVRRLSERLGLTDHIACAGHCRADRSLLAQQITAP